MLVPSVFEKYLFDSCFPQQSCQLVTLHVSLQENHWFFNRVRMFRSSTGWQSYSHWWATFRAVAIVWKRGVLTCAHAKKLMPRRWPHPPCQDAKGLELVSTNFAAANFRSRSSLLREYCCVFIVVCNVVSSVHDSSIVWLEMSWELEVSEMAEIHEGCETFLKSQVGKLFNVYRALSTAALASGIVIAFSTAMCSYTRP